MTLKPHKTLTNNTTDDAFFFSGNGTWKCHHDANEIQANQHSDVKGLISDSDKMAAGHFI